MKCSTIYMLALLHTSWCAAQTANYGEFHVEPGTIVSVQDDFTNFGGAVLVNDGQMYASGDVRNEGVFNNTNNANSGNLILNGFLPQQIIGSSPLILHDITMEHLSGTNVNVENDVRVNGSAFFDSGVLEIDPIDGTLVFQEESAQFFASDNSHVEGEMFKYGEAPFVFPSGMSGYYRPASISAPAALTDGYRCEYKLEDSDLLYPHTNYTGIIEQINDAEYWEINREQGSSEVVIGLSYHQGITPSFILNNLERVHVVRWDFTTNTWVDEGGVHDATDEMIYTVGKVDNFGVYTLAVVDADYADDEIVVYNIVTADGNGENDVLLFGGLEKFPENTVTIVNRWGEPVYGVEGYDNGANAFAGYANQGIVNSSILLPDGTYFYVLQYTDDNGEVKKKVGYLQLSEN